MDAMKVSAAELAEISSAYPGLPPDYFTYLGSFGWGEAASGRMIYNRPVVPQEVYGADFGHTDIVLLGDDLAGHCFGYDLAAATYGEFTPNGSWQAWPSSQGFNQYAGA